MQWLMQSKTDTVNIDSVIRPYGAEELTRAQCRIFDQLVSV